MNPDLVPFDINNVTTEPELCFKDKERCEDPFKDGRMLESPAQLPSVALKDDTSKKFINSLETFELSPGTQRYAVPTNSPYACLRQTY